MKSAIIISLFLFIACASAFRCYRGTQSNGVGTVSRVDCQFGYRCWTKVERRTGGDGVIPFTQTVRDCKEPAACEAASTRNHFLSCTGTNGESVCFYCCDSDLCNDLSDIPNLE